MIVRRIAPKQEVLTKKVAAYARVSTNQEKQSESYETQKEYYQGLIESTPNWVFAGIYADKGRTGTMAKHRPGFLQMIADAREGKIDIILVKSISRFSRNLGECQEYVSILRGNGVVVIFEEQNIRTDDAGSSFALSLNAAVAQDESHSIGQNRRWAYQKRFEEGKYNLGSNRILGYDTVDGKLVPNGDAWIIREIFERFTAGEGYTAIAKYLKKKGATTLRGGDFSIEAIRYILINETYVGDKHLMKRPPTDYITHRPNKSLDYKDYYLTDDHEPIVDRELWDNAQSIIKGFKDNKLVSGGEHHFLYGKVFCGECGAPFVRRTCTKRDGTTFKAWNCRERQKGKNGNGCKCRIVKEEELLKEIWDQLGRKDEERFTREISRVEIGEESIKVIDK